MKYDDVLNDQRKVVFEQRLELMESTNISETVSDMRREVIEDMVDKHIPERAYAEQWDAVGLKTGALNILNLDLPVEDWVKEEGIGEDDIRERLTEAANAAFTEKAERFGDDIMHYVERSIVMQTLDHLWREHIVNLDHLRSVIGFRGYAQRDPLQEYKSEAFELFTALLNNLREAVTAQLMRVELVQQAPAEPEPPLMQAHHLDPTTGEDDFAPAIYQASEVIVSPENRNPDDPATGARSAATRPAPAAPARNTSIATAPSSRSEASPQDPRKCRLRAAFSFLRLRRKTGISTSDGKPDPEPFLNPVLSRLQGRFA